MEMGEHGLYTQHNQNDGAGALNVFATLHLLRNGANVQNFEYRVN